MVTSCYWLIAPISGLLCGLAVLQTALFRTIELRNKLFARLRREIRSPAELDASSRGQPCRIENTGSMVTWIEPTPRRGRKGSPGMMLVRSCAPKIPLEVHALSRWPGHGAFLDAPSVARSCPAWPSQPAPARSARPPCTPASNALTSIPLNALNVANARRNAYRVKMQRITAIFTR